MELSIIVGTRPQFVKLGALLPELRSHSIEYEICDTGQHYDYNLAAQFQDELGIDKPVTNLGIGGQPLNAMLSKMILALDQHLKSTRPKMCLVIGDTISTLAGAISTSNLGIPLLHLEGGLRSFDLTMPEERNRQLTDRLAMLNFAPTSRAVANLKNEHLVASAMLSGDVMLDLALRLSPADGKRQEKAYVSLHRPSNVDNVKRWGELEAVFKLLAKDFDIVWPVHPRAKKLADWLDGRIDNLKILQPASYSSNLSLIGQSKLAITDSGGVQKEAYFLSTPCITLRQSTEWPETLESHWNQLAYDIPSVEQALSIAPTVSGTPDLSQFGSGMAAGTIAQRLEELLKP